MAATRRPIVGGNWKMNTLGDSGETLAKGVAQGFAGLDGTDAFVCPPFPYLSRVGAALAGSGVVLAAQDIYHEASGASSWERPTGLAAQPCP